MKKKTQHQKEGQTKRQMNGERERENQVIERERPKIQWARRMRGFSWKRKGFEQISA